MDEQFEGYVEKIIFRNAENGYTVLSLSTEKDEELTCVGNFTFIGEGEFLHVSGGFTSHPVYGEQFQVRAYEVREPENMIAMERYLGSGAIRGIGPALAARIVAKFKEDTFRIMDEEPERLAQVKGISEKMARDFAVQFEEKRGMRSAMVFLQQYGISTGLAVKIYQKYGDRMNEVIQQNPYQLAEDIRGVGFKIADDIAAKVGIGADSGYRLRAGILYMLSQAAGNGHVYLPQKELLYQTGFVLGVAEGLEEALDDLRLERKVIFVPGEDDTKVYTASYYYLELNTARMLIDLNVSYDLPQQALAAKLARLQQNLKLELEEHQAQAVLTAARSGVFLLTGGPGTGKTTTINAIINFFESEGMEILLAAPTGRAAKRMKETTGHESSTIHRLLELSRGIGDEDGDSQTARFERNESNPLETDVLIIDEMSMVDISLMHALLRAVTVGTRVIFVGDVNQLPSVGPGNVLRDMIRSDVFPVVRLTKIFRQASESDIIVNAHKINAGEPIRLDNKSRDFFMLKRDDVNVITGVLIALIRDKLPKYVEATPYDIQVLTPMRKGELGVERLNQVLQQYLNPPSPDRKEKEFRQTIFREGDKVMQIRNNYQLTWEVKNRYGITVDAGEGVFNGDTGIIRQINTFAEEMTVEFDEGRMVAYPFGQLEELELAYAVTIHKSQGSEYPAVLLPLLTGPRMLFNRNLLYTAVTRAKRCVTIVGSDRTVQAMIENESEQKRYSGLMDCIREMAQSGI
ncbi:MAG: ATP-dependent RecD-like DNA helicase [Lachnospiraceae bacterium]|nr:ATP-dependent RecD-like DNA helicase [Lachnospiraceae bacterium]